jgi:FtsP/CotA-like multicopper oxidase with cupredoxin domain
MSTGQLLAVDLLVGVVGTGAWLGAGATVLAGRTRVAAGLFLTALVATLARIASVVALAGAGWWFVQEKVLLGVPLLGVALLAAWAGLRMLRRGAPGAGTALSLLSAGYASAAGLVVTVLFGYPATAAVVLVTFALVGVAVLVTWRVLGHRVPRLATAGVAALGLVGAGLAAVPASAPADMTGMDHHGVSVATLRGPATPAPGGAVRRFTLTARTGDVRLASGRRVAAWTFNGQLPGPPITVTQGDLVDVRLRNADITVGVTLHWHGYDVPAAEDGAPGVTQRAVSPGHGFRYRFRADQVGTYWYHTHSMSAQGVRMGLYGALVVKPRSSAAGGLDLTVPVHTVDDAVVFGRADRLDRRRVAPGTPVRLRLVNTDSTPHRFTLAGTAYRLVAVDGTDLHGPTPLTRTGLVLAAGGRYDLAFRMPSRGVALLADDDGATGLRLVPPGVSATPKPPDTAGWPELDLTRYGTPTRTPLGGHVDRDFTLVLDRGLAMVDGRPGYAQTVNGRAHPSIPDQVVREGDLVRLTIVNRSRETHPWHLHGHRVLVLSRDGRTPTGSPLWLDSVDVRPGEVWRVAFRADNPGVWMNHCHNLDHATAGMVLHLRYEGVTSPYHGGRE